MTPTEILPILSRTTPRFLALVFALMLALFVLTGFLTGKYNREKHRRAELQYEAGQRLVAEGRYKEAIDQYTVALELSRENLEYLQALALALVKAGRTSEAETYLSELIRSDPANGVANLMLARIYAARGDVQQATGYYQRAIYGLWPDGLSDRRLEVRFELAEYLQKAGETMEMEAELLRLVDEMPDKPEVQKRAGRLFLAAGSYDNAAEMFRRVVRSNKQDADAYAALGDAEFERGDYVAARTAYRQALRYRPEDLQSRMQLELAGEILDLDPTRRGLGSSTELRRSQALVRRSLAALDYCLPKDLGALPEDFRGAVVRGRGVAEGKARQRATTETVESNIALSEEIQRFQRDLCGTAPVPDRALDLVLKKLSE